jgi:hypothetical protein
MRSARNRSRSLDTYFMRDPSLSPERSGSTKDVTVAKAATAASTMTTNCGSKRYPYSVDMTRFA